MMRKVKHNMNQISGTAKFFLNSVFLVSCAACVLPVLLVLAISLSDEHSILLHGYQFIPDKITFLSYQYLFEDSATIFRAYGVTLLVTVLGTMLSVLMMALFAYPISRKDFPFRTFFAFLIFLPMLFNGGLVPRYIIYTRLLDLRDSLWGLIIPLLVAPFNVLIMRTFFQNTIPASLIEAAKIDGAGEIRVFSQIVLPLSLPVLATMGLFSVIAYWNDWFNSLLYISNVKLFSLQYLMVKVMRSLEFLQTNREFISSAGASDVMGKLPAETVRMAMVIVGMGPIILAYPFFQKYFVKGLTVGAIKG